MKRSSRYVGLQDAVIEQQGGLLETQTEQTLLLCLYDKHSGAGGLCHIPYSELTKAVKTGHQPPENFLKLLRLFKQSASSPDDLEAKLIAGKAEKRLQEEAFKHMTGLFRRFAIPVAGSSASTSSERRVRFDCRSHELFFQAVAQPSEKSDPSDQQKAKKNTEKSASNAKSAPQSQAVRFPIKVLIVDDSKAIRVLFEKVFSTDTRFQVVGSVEHPIEAEALLDKKDVDLVTLDLHMPEMDGLTYLRTDFKKRQLPAIVVSSQANDNKLVFDCLEAGAVDFLEKPNIKDIDRFSEVLHQKTIAAMSAKLDSIKKTSAFKPSRLTFKGSYGPNHIILLGASTGGTNAIKDIFDMLPDKIPPIVIVQHIPAGFSKSFADRLNETAPFTVKEAEDGDKVEPNKVLIAPGGYQMAIKKAAQGYFVRLSDDPPVNKFKPSVDFLFNSATKVVGKQAVTVLLTGMGKDGAQGMLAMKQVGSRTIAQDEASSVVFGMPKEAIELGAADSVLHLNDIASDMLQQLNMIAHRPGAA